MAPELLIAGAHEVCLIEVRVETLQTSATVTATRNAELSLQLQLPVNFESFRTIPSDFGSF